MGGREGGREGELDPVCCASSIFCLSFTSVSPLSVSYQVKRKEGGHLGGRREGEDCKGPCTAPRPVL